MLTETFAQSRKRRTASPAPGDRGARAVLAGLALALLPGCGTLYLAQAAHGEWEVLHDRRPIDTVLSDARTPAPLRARLAEVKDAREFATRRLGLPDNQSYRSYADLKRTYVVWNVIATPEFAVEPLRWCFPIAGCVAYRGYFAQGKAQDFGERLRKRGFDVAVEGVPAYSTLGRFADPVLNTMMIYGDSELAAIVFHELAHQLIYVAGDSEFNEAFAVTVEETGLARWLESTGRTEQLNAYRAERARDFEFNTLFARCRAELGRLYASGVPPELMRERKRMLLSALAQNMRDLARREHVPEAYEEWIADGLNNAYLAAVATYFDCLPGFKNLLARSDGDLPRFYGAVRALARQSRAERHRQLCAPSAQGNEQARLAAPHLDDE